MTEADKELQASIEKEKELRLYELGYHLLPTTAEEAVPEEALKLRDNLEKHKGIMVSDQMPRTITLTYSMPKIVNEKRKYFDTALFGWIKFQMFSEDVLEFEKELKQNKNILRFILMKTTEEKALPPKKMTFLKSKRAVVSKMGVEKKKGPEKVLSEEELDKTIEELVVE